MTLNQETINKSNISNMLNYSEKRNSIHVADFIHKEEILENPESLTVKKGLFKSTKKLNSFQNMVNDSFPEIPSENASAPVNAVKIPANARRLLQQSTVQQLLIQQQHSPNQKGITQYYSAIPDFTFIQFSAAS